MILPIEVPKEITALTKSKGWKNGKIMNVLGQQDEPICTYYRCHHKPSVHATRICRCKHPMNKILAILVE